MCGVFFEGVGDWVGGKRGNEIPRSWYPLLKQRNLVPPHPIPKTLKKTPHTSCIAALQVKSQPADGPRIGPKHVVVYLLYY